MVNARRTLKTLSECGASAMVGVKPGSLQSHEWFYNTDPGKRAKGGADGG